MRSACVRRASISRGIRRRLAGGEDFRHEINTAETPRRSSPRSAGFSIASPNPARASTIVPPAGEVVDARPSAGDRARRYGEGGPGRVRKTLRINGGNEIGKSVEKSLDDYFRKLDGEPPHGIYDMVITHVERAVIESVMTRANGNQTQAADMLGLNRNTLRAKLAKYGIR
jgi:Fis family transcriptional regulator